MRYFEGPKRPKSHQIGDKAENQIIDIFSSQGWVINPILSDYGDDLNVQLTEGTTLIPIRFYVQIKGTTNLEKFQRKSTYKISKIKRTSIIHWLNSETPTLLVLWDVKSKSGLYGFADAIFSNFDERKRTKFYTATFHEDHSLDAKSIKNFKINVIARHCNQQYVTNKGMLSLIKKDKRLSEEYGIEEKVIKGHLFDTILFYLTSIGIISVNKKDFIYVVDKFKNLFVNEFERLVIKERLVEKFTNKKFDLIFDSTLMYVLIKWRSEKFNHGTQSALLEGSFEILRAYFNDTKRKSKKLFQK